MKEKAEEKKILKNRGRLVYLDNAATSFPKPESVQRAVQTALRFRCGNPGRAGHSLSMSAARDIFSLREAASDFFSCSSPENVIVTPGATYSLNYAIYALSCDGGTALCSDIEHNAVRRPLLRAANAGLINYKFQAGNLSNEELLSRLESRMKKNKPKFLVCTHSSNVFSRVLPIKEIGELCSIYGAMFILDAAQSAGHLEINTSECKIDALCVPGHKGLYGPSGLGLLVVSDNFKDKSSNYQPLILGGAGISSLDTDMPKYLPERFEAGTLPSFLCAGLCEGINFVKSLGFERIQRHENNLFSMLSRVLKEREENVICYGGDIKSGNVISFNIKGLPCGRVAELFSQGGVCLRSGFHCAPSAHNILGSRSLGGSVRISVGAFNNEKDIRIFTDILDMIISSKQRIAE